MTRFAYPPRRSIVATATVEGETVRVGDYVGFKSDIEQRGQITRIERDYRGTVWLTLENLDGFSGDYLRYATTTCEEAKRCWVE